MKLLLTGTTGFVGRNLLLSALKDNRYEQIFLPLRNIEKFERQLAEDGYPEIPSHVIVTEAKSPDWEFDPAPVDHMVHSAGILFARTQKEYFNDNVMGTLNLLARIRTRPKIVILSSQSAGGPCEKNQKEKTEQDKDTPVTWYGESKLEMEKLIKEKFPHHPIRFLRPPMILGPRDTTTLPLFKMAMSSVRFKPGLKEKHYSFISVGDLVSAIWATLDNKENWAPDKPQNYYVASNLTVSDLQLIQTAAELCQKKGSTLYVPQPLIWLASRVIDAIPSFRKAVPTLTRDRAKEVWPDRQVVSSRLFNDAFGWVAQEGLAQALQGAHDWYRQTGQLK